MKKFDFRLQKVLDVKEMVLKKMKKDLALLKKQKAESEKELNRLLNNFEEFCSKMHLDKEQTISEIKLEYSYYYQYLDEIELQKKEIADLNIKIEQLRKKFIETQQDKKVLSKLKDKYNEIYIVEQQKKEQVLLDEIAVIGAHNSGNL